MKSDSANIPRSEQFEYFMARVCTTFDVSRESILGRSKEPRFAWPRQVLCYALREVGWELPRIGDLIGRDGSTVHHAWSTVRRRMVADRDSAHLVNVVMDGYKPYADLREDERALRELEDSVERIIQAVASAVVAVTGAVVVLERMEARARSLRNVMANPIRTRGAA